MKHLSKLYYTSLSLFLFTDNVQLCFYISKLPGSTSESCGCKVRTHFKAQISTRYIYLESLWAPVASHPCNEVAVSYNKTRSLQSNLSLVRSRRKLMVYSSNQRGHRGRARREVNARSSDRYPASRCRCDGARRPSGLDASELSTGDPCPVEITLGGCASANADP